MNKLPNKFEFEVKGVGASYWMTLQPDGDYYVTNPGFDAVGDVGCWNIGYVQTYIDSGEWVITKNLDTQKYPDHFVFELSSGTKFDMNRDECVWKCTHYGTDYGGATYSEEEIDDSITSGWWTIVEPELVFPFTFKVNGNGWEYTAVSIDEDDRVLITWEDGYGEGTSDSTYPKDNVKSLIKRGTWIVKSVGEAPQKPVEPPTSVVSKLVVDVDSTKLKEAVELLKEFLALAEKVQSLKIFNVQE